MPRTSMDGTGNDSLIKTTKTTEWNFNYGGFISLAFGGFLLLGCLIAYVIAVVRGNVDPFLPLISDAAGSPPQNGIFGTFICLGGMFGVAFMILRYMIVLEKNHGRSSLVTTVNRMSLFIGVVSMFGTTLVTGYPINFYRNRDIWLMDVGLPHIIGGVMLFALGLVYIGLQCVLTLFLKSKSKSTLFVRVLLLFICTASFVYHMITVPDNFRGVAHKYYINGSDISDFNNTDLLPYPPTLGASLKLPIDTSGSYIASSVAEWLFVIFFCCFIFTFFSEAQRYSLLIVIETHSTKEPEPIEDTKAEIRRLSLAVRNSSIKVDVKPAPEVRKVLRRDSTCQTMTDGLETTPITKNKKDISNGIKKTASKKPAPKKSPSNPPKLDVANGTKQILKNVETDVQTDMMLDEKKSENKNGVSKQVKTVETGTTSDDLPEEIEEEIQEASKIDVEKEAERIAIEKIDIVVKDAEEKAAEIILTVKEEEKKDAKNESNGNASACGLSIQ